jgi:tetrahydromethanopterin S-methyltransferase subunit B
MTTTYEQAKTEALQARIADLEWVLGQVISSLDGAEAEAKAYAENEGHSNSGAMFWSGAFGWLSGSVTSTLSTAKTGLAFRR